MSLEVLKILRAAMRTNDETVCDEHGQWRTDLPTFGGEAPRVWSYDKHWMLIGTCADDLMIVQRP